MTSPATTAFPAPSASSAAGRLIVVGVDGSESGHRALLWAAHEAAVSSAPLRILHAEMWPVASALRGSAAEQATDGIAAAGDILPSAVAEVEDLGQGIAVTTHVDAGYAEKALVDASRHAGTVVVGSRGLGTFSGLLLHSISHYVTSHAYCPVAVVRGSAPPGGAIVAGVHGQPGRDDPVLSLAFEQARRRGVPLVAVHSTAAGRSRLRGVTGRRPDDRGKESARTHPLDWALDPWVEAFPDVRVVRRQSDDPPAAAVLYVSRGAQLVVVGSRVGGEIRGMLLGSVTRAVIDAAPCPVLVHRDGAR